MSKETVMSAEQIIKLSEAYVAHHEKRESRAFLTNRVVFAIAIIVTLIWWLK